MNFAEAQLRQNELLERSLQSREKDSRHSVMQIRPAIQWVKIDDATVGQELIDAVDLFEDNCGYANDGEGMLPKEMLSALKGILKTGSAKMEIYKNVGNYTKSIV